MGKLPGQPGQILDTAVTAAVVHEDDFVVHRSMGQQAVDALAGEVESVVGQDDDRNPRGSGRFGNLLRNAGFVGPDPLRAGQFQPTVRVDPQIRFDGLDPALVQPLDIFRHVGEARRSALGLVMDHHALGFVNQQPAVPLEPEAEVDIFVAVPVRFIETFGSGKQFVANQQTGRGESLIGATLVGVR